MCDLNQVENSEDDQDGIVESSVNLAIVDDETARRENLDSKSDHTSELSQTFLVEQTRTNMHITERTNEDSTLH